MFSVPEWLLTLGSPERGHWPVSPGQPWWHSVNIETRHNVATNNKQGQVPPPPPLTYKNIHNSGPHIYIKQMNRRLSTWYSVSVFMMAWWGCLDVPHNIPIIVCPPVGNHLTMSSDCRQHFLPATLHCVAINTQEICELRVGILFWIQEIIIHHEDYLHKTSHNCITFTRP